MTDAPRPLTLILASPRGFCAGVDRAIQIVEMALTKFGPPVYVRHEIVHNRFVVEALERKGAIFVEELDEVPEGGKVIFSAHGVPKSVPAAAEARELIYFDATCPLVSKVHIEAGRLHERGLQILLIGHAGHPEVIGTMGQLPEGAVTLVETLADVEAFEPEDASKLALQLKSFGFKRGRTSAPFSADRRATQRRHLLCDNQSSGSSENHRPARGSRAGDWRSQFLQFHAACRSGRTRRMQLLGTCSTCSRH